MPGETPQTIAPPTQRRRALTGTDEKKNMKTLNLLLRFLSTLPQSKRIAMLLHLGCSAPALGMTSPAPRREIGTRRSRQQQRHRPTSSSLSAVATRAAARPPSLAGDWRDLRIRHVVESQQFSRECMDLVFETAREMEQVEVGTAAARQLEGRVMATLFYEPSTRTRLSFESARARLGGTVLSTESAGEYSSAAKGETLEGECGRDRVSPGGGSRRRR